MITPQSSIQLAKLERVHARSIWESEALDFTPWLAQEINLELLGETLGINLQLVGTEKHAGIFRADIVCQDVDTGHYVVIENQLDRTDHVHLGQLLAYASGLDALTAIWVASSFTDEHRATLDWLNRFTLDTLQFYGVEIELWTIGQSGVAPRFNVVSTPNNWTRKVNKKVSSVQYEERAMDIGAREKIKRAMLDAIANGRKVKYADIAQAANVGYSTVKKYARELRAELNAPREIAL